MRHVVQLPVCVERQSLQAVCGGKKLWTSEFWVKMKKMIVSVEIERRVTRLSQMDCAAW